MTSDFFAGTCQIRYPGDITLLKIGFIKIHSRLYLYLSDIHVSKTYNHPRLLALKVSQIVPLAVNPASDCEIRPYPWFDASFRTRGMIAGRIPF